MNKRCLILLTITFIIACLINMDYAAGYQPSIQTIDRVDGIVYHQNGSVSHSIISSILTVINPSSASPLTAVNVKSPDGSAWFIKNLEPQSNFTQPYTIRDDNITIPLKLNEYIAPSSLYAGMQQEIRILVEIENTGDSNITDFFYQKALPAGLNMEWASSDGGIVSINDTLTWTLDDMAPGQKSRMVAAFNATPASDINFTAASIHFTYLKPQARDDPAFSGYTNTTFKLAHSYPGAGIWQVNATVPDESDFDIILDSVKIYRSHVSDPFNVTEIASYTPNIMLSTGSEWNTELVDYYDLVPAYFIKINYTIPYTLDRKTFFTASTEPFSIAVYTPTVTQHPPIYHYNYPYIIWNPTIAPTPTPIPSGYIDIVFISPGSGAVIRDNMTLIKTSVPPSSNAGYVIYYGSNDNQTWEKIGESNITGNISEIMWTVPQINGIYYLKVEHYDSMGLRGVDYAQLVIAHEIQPVNITTMLISASNWLMPFLIIIVMTLLLFILIPYLPRKPIVYDSSSLCVLSKDYRLSRLTRQAIRPEVDIPGISGLERIKARPVRDLDGMKRLQDEYGLPDFDAMALQLAREIGATLYTADRRIYEIGKRLGIDVKLLERKEND